MALSQKSPIGVDRQRSAPRSVPFESRSTTNAITPIVYGQTRSSRRGNRSKPVRAEQSIPGGRVGNPAGPRSQRRPRADAFFSHHSGQFFWADAKSGNAIWTSEPRQAGNAAIVRAGDLLFVLKEDGQLIVARNTPGSFVPLKTYTVADSATWAAPAISGNRIFVKDVETLALWTLN